MLSMGYPLWEKGREKKKSCSPYLSNKAGKQNIKYVVVAEAAKTGSYKLKAEKMAASIETRQDPLLLPAPKAPLLGGSRPSTPLPPPWVNAIRTSNFQIHAMRGGGQRRTPNNTRCTKRRHAARRNQMENNVLANTSEQRTTGQLEQGRAHTVQRREEIPSPCSQAVECLLLYRLLWEAGATWIHQETSYLQDP